MSEPTTEQEKYSIDEMMDRLKTRDESEKPGGELVTRSDGSQAMKVKKRRRRTDQSVNKETKRNNRIQILQITGFVILIVIAGLAAGIGVLYANSSSFRDGLIAKAETSSGAKVEMKQFRMNPATANSNVITMEWPAGNPLDSLFLRYVSAKIAPVSFLGKTFSGDEIIASQGELILKAPVAGGDVRHTKKDSGGVLPMKFSRYSVPSIDIFFGGEKTYGDMLQKSEISLFPSNLSGHAEVRLTGGLLKKQGWPPMQLDRSYIKVRGASLEVKSMRFTIPQPANERSVDRGFLDFSGTVEPLDANGTHILEAKMETFNLSYLLGADIGRFFLGKVETSDTAESNFLAFTPGTGEEASLQVKLTNALDSRIDLSGFNFLSKLALTLGDRWYELPNFEDDISMIVKRQGNKVDLREINLVKRGRLALRGEITNGPGGTISGTLRLGLPDAIVATSQNKRISQMFGEVREGYRWVDLKISGTSAVPNDNFRELYDEARTDAADQPAVGPATKDSFDDLVAPE